MRKIKTNDLVIDQKFATDNPEILIPIAGTGDASIPLLANWPTLDGEFWGEGLLPDDRPDLITKTFEIRLVPTIAGIEVQFADKGSGWHSIQAIEGDISLDALNEFEQTVGRFTARSVEQLLRAYCLLMTQDLSAMNEALKAILDDVKETYETLLLSRRYLDTTRGNPVHVMKRRGRGRLEKSAAGREAEKLQFKQNVFNAMRELASAGRKTRRQDVGEILFPKAKNPEFNVHDKLKEFGLKWTELKEEFNSLN